MINVFFIVINFIAFLETSSDMHGSCLRISLWALHCIIVHVLYIYMHIKLVHHFISSKNFNIFSQ